MIYVLKFAAAWVLPPGIFILALFGIAAYLWRRHRLRRTAGALAGIALVFYLLTTGAVADLLMGSLERTYAVPERPEGDVIVMLGGGAIGGVQLFAKALERRGYCAARALRIRSLSPRRFTCRAPC